MMVYTEGGLYDVNDQFMAKVLGKVGNLSILYVVRGAQVNYVVAEDYEKSGEYMPSSSKNEWFRSFEEATNFIYKKRYDRLYRISFIPSKDIFADKTGWHTVVKGKRGVDSYLEKRMKEMGLGDNAYVLEETESDGSVSYLLPVGKIIVKPFKLGDVIR